MKQQVKIGAFTTKQWEFDMWCKFFFDMAENCGGVTKTSSGQARSGNEAVMKIESDLYYIDIVYNVKEQYMLGRRYDIVFNSTNNEQYRNEIITPMMCNSIFNRRQED